MKEHIKLRNESGLEITVVTHIYCKCQGMMGGMEETPDWEEYLSDINDDYKPHFELIRLAIIELGWVGETADRFANYICFTFSDGFGISFSWRAWGDIMSAIVGNREGYMAYYM